MLVLHGGELSGELSSPPCLVLQFAIGFGAVQLQRLALETLGNSGEQEANWVLNAVARLESQSALEIDKMADLLRSGVVCKSVALSDEIDRSVIVGWTVSHEPLQNSW